MFGLRQRAVAGPEGEVSDAQPDTDAVSIVDLTYRYPGAHVDVLRNVSLSLREGEFLSIVGPSGCGKTTLLDCVAGFLMPSSGEVRVRGERVTEVVPGRAGFMFARDTLLPWRSAIGNVELAIILRERRNRRSRHTTPARVREEAKSLLMRVGLTGFEDYLIEELSHGMRQRVALARTLAINVPLILMDEPFGALDAQTRLVMQNEFLSVWEKQRRSVILITHDVAEAIVMSDRIIVLGGRPARVVADIPVRLKRPRDVVAVHGEGGGLFREVWDRLEAATLERPGAADD
jgi:NitT/TauT family transport system ATP-binding protein